MSMFENPENLRLLRNLLKTDNDGGDNTDTDTDEETTPLQREHLKKRFLSKAQPQAPPQPKPSKDDAHKPLIADKPIESIEEWQERQQQEDAELLDTRKCPEYRLAYRQAIGTEDVFLQMGNRTNASSSCENLILEILLPDETSDADKMNLNITANEVDLSTPVYRLKLPLVQRVNVDRSQAQYVAAERKLILTLRMQRDLDFINF